MLRSSAATLLSVVLVSSAAWAAPSFDFELYDLSDRLVRLQALRRASRLVVVDFFSLSCKPCRRALPAWKKLFARFASRGVAFVIVALPDDEDDRDRAYRRVQRFFKGQALPFSVVWDKYGLVARRYGVLKKGSLILPRAFIVSSGGKVVHQGMAPKAVGLQIKRRLEAGRR